MLETLLGLGFFEIVVIAVAVLLLFGPQKLPGVIQQVAKFYVQLRRTSSEFRGAFDDFVRQAENDVRIEEINRLQALIDATKKSMASDPTQALLGEDLNKTVEKSTQDLPQPRSVAASLAFEVESHPSGEAPAVASDQTANSEGEPMASHNKNESTPT